MPASATFAVDDVQNYSKSWNIGMSFFQLDYAESTQDQYALILDLTDELVDKFINRLNFYSLKADSITLTSMNQTPFVKQMADILTGHTLTFTLIVLDDFNYCGLDC